MNNHGFLSSITRLTTGGLQFWTDYRFRHGYRIQQHAITAQWRLIDRQNRRVTSGTREHCDITLDSISDKERWAEIEQPFIVLLHGLSRTAYCMRPLQRYLEAEGHPNVLRFSYASTRASILRHGDALSQYVASLPPKSSLSFIGHSMGNIVLRAAISLWQQSDAGTDILQRMHRVVMLGPPNQGAIIARKLAPTGVFEWIHGPSGMELGVNWETIRDHLGTPPCPFAIVAGDLASIPLRNPLVDRASDLVVAVTEAHLEGATELKVLPVSHTTLMSNRQVMRYVADFLQRPLPDTLAAH